MFLRGPFINFSLLGSTKSYVIVAKRWWKSGPKIMKGVHINYYIWGHSLYFTGASINAYQMGAIHNKL